MKPSFLKVILTIIPIALLIMSCSRVVLREGAAPGVRVPEVRVRYNSVGIIDKSLEDWDGPIFDPAWTSMFAVGRKEHDKRSKIAVESTDARRSPTGTLMVWAVLRNRTDQSLQVEGRTTFFDVAKVPAEKPSEWRRVMLPPQAIATYRESSTKSDEISFYYIEIREGR